MATVDFTLDDIQKLIHERALEERKYTETLVKTSLLEERQVTEKLIHKSALEERKHSRRAIDDSGRKLLQNKRELTRAMVQQELSGETGSFIGRITSLGLAVGQNSRDIAEIKAQLASAS